MSNDSFIIVHTAKEVEYKIKDFREKNKDEINQITVQTIKNSAN